MFYYSYNMINESTSYKHVHTFDSKVLISLGFSDAIFLEILKSNLGLIRKWKLIYSNVTALYIYYSFT